MKNAKLYKFYKPYHLTINTDGASRDNPGHASAAFVIRNYKDEIIDKQGIYLGIATNNEAEYWAVKLAFSRLIEAFPKKLPAEIEVKADSLLVVNQLSGDYQVKNINLKSLYESIKILEQEVGKVKYTYIPRKENKQADYLCNLAIDIHLRDD